MARDNSIEVLIKVIDDATGELRKITNEFKKLDDPIKKAGKSLGDYLNNFKRVAGVTTAIFAVGAGVRKLVQETSAAEQAQAQLAAALQSNGNAAGFTAQQLNQVAKQLQRTTTFSREAVTSAQTLLLSFNNIRGDNFTRTTRAVVDLSARLGKDLTSTALLVGRALNDPVGSLGALSRSGVQFSKTQELVIKRLVESGKVAEAQGVILTALEKRFGGAAQAARNTLGGALAALRNSFGGLFEASKVGTSEAVKSINSLTDALDKPETKRAVDTLAKLFFDLGAAITNASAKFINFLAPGTDAIGKATVKVQQLEVALKAAFADRNYKFAAELQKELEQAKRTLASIRRPSRGGRAQEEDPVAAITGAPKVPVQDPAEAAKLAAEKLKDLTETQNLLAESFRSTFSAGIAAIQSVETPLEKIQREFDTAYEALENFKASFSEYPELVKQATEAQQRLGVNAAEAVNKLGRLPQDLEGANDKLSGLTVFADQAARNIQSSFANFLFNPFEEGLKGMLKGFVDTLRRMVAELVAQQALIAFFRIFTNGTGIVADFANAAVKSLSGERAMGGPVSGGSSYLVGERGPEIFTPGASGMITPNNRLGGGVTVAPVYNIDARGATQDLVKFLPSILEENTRRAVELARRSIYDDLSRGAFGRA